MNQESQYITRSSRKSRNRRRLLQKRLAFLLFLLLILALPIGWFIVSRWPLAETAPQPSASSVSSQPGLVPEASVDAGTYAQIGDEVYSEVYDEVYGKVDGDVYADVYAPPTDIVPPQDETPPTLSLPFYPAASWDAEPPLLGKTENLAADPFFDQAFFIGDSITTGLDSLAEFDQRPYLAEMGLTLEKALHRVENYADLRPRVIFILLGANDMTYYNMDEALYVERYAALIHRLRELFPEAAIFPQALLPVATFYTGNAAVTNERIASFNQALAAMCAEEGLVLVDIGAAWRLPDQTLHPDVTSDGLHIMYAYYGSWLQILKDYAEAVLGSVHSAGA